MGPERPALALQVTALVEKYAQRVELRSERLGSRQDAVLARSARLTTAFRPFFGAVLATVYAPDLLCAAAGAAPHR